MVSLSFQPNEVLARTKSSTVLGLLPIPFAVQNYPYLFTMFSISLSCKQQTTKNLRNSAVFGFVWFLALSRKGIDDAHHAILHL